MTEQPRIVEPREFKSLVQAMRLRRLGGMAGLHRIYLGAPGGQLMFTALVASFAIPLAVLYIAHDLPPDGQTHYGLLAALLTGPFIWVVLKFQSWLDGINCRPSRLRS